MTNEPKSYSINELSNSERLASNVRWQLTLRIAGSRSSARAAHLRKFFLFSFRRERGNCGVNEPLMRPPVPVAKSR